jgi:hypothetical protein
MSRSAFEATFSDFRIVKGRKVGQLIFELPIEAVDAALETLGGVPRPDKEAWVGIARLRQETSKEPEKVDISSPNKERRPFGSLPLSQQAALRCNDSDFWKFINQACGVNSGINSAEGAAMFVRSYCNVVSRSEIKLETEKGDRWIDLNDKYDAWLRDRNFR